MKSIPHYLGNNSIPYYLGNNLADFAKIKPKRELLYRFQRVLGWYWLSWHLARFKKAYDFPIYSRFSTPFHTVWWAYGDVGPKDWIMRWFASRQPTSMK